MAQTQPIGENGAIALIALGSNEKSEWGDATTIVLKAMLAVEKLLWQVPFRSKLYQTPAFPDGAGPDFVNAVIRVFTTLSAQELLEKLHQIEADAGRERLVRWGQRTLDLDLLALGDSVLPNASEHETWRDLPLAEQAKHAPTHIILPHPRLQDRSFVLVPMADVAPDWRHPLLGQTVVEMRDARPMAEIESVRAI